MATQRHGHRTAPASPPARFRPLTPLEAEGKAGELLTDRRHGQVGDMVVTKLDRALGERVPIAGPGPARMPHLPPRHFDAARSVGVSDAELDLARTGSSGDPRLAALLDFAIKVLTAPATTTDDDVVGLLAEGYTEREIVDVVGVVALNQLTGSFNLVAGL